MDPVSAASAIAGLVALSGTIISKGYQYIAAVKHAPQELRLLLTEVAGLNELLDRFQLLPSTTDESKNTKALNYVQGGTIATCTELLNSIEGTVDKCIQIKDQNKMKLAKRLIWPYKESETKDVLQRLERMKSTLSTAISLDLEILASSAIQNIEEHLSEDLSSIKSRQQRQERQDLLQWLKPAKINFDEKRKTALELRQPGTGTWLLNSESFKLWQNSTNGLLWISGIPGSGKTVLATTIIEQLEVNSISSSTATTYFYFDHKDTATHSLQNFVTHTIVQLINLNSEGYHDLENLYENCHKDHSRTPALNDLLDLLRALSNRFVRTYVVLDALDEIADITAFLKGLEDLRAYMDESSKFWILSTSRRELVIERSMITQKAIQVQISSNETQSDLRDYIHSQIRQRIADRRLKLRDPRLEHEIATTLIDHADGMFLWARLQLDRISSLNSDKSIRRALGELPIGLDSTYIRALEKIQVDYPDDLETVKRILTWVISSTRKLSLLELAEAVSIEDGDKFRDITAIATDPHDLLGLCGSLLNIEDDDNDQLVSVIHLSLEEYLRSPRIVQSSVAYFYVDDEEASAALASTCLQYIGFADFEKPCTTEKEFAFRLQDYTLFKYAAMYWPTHLCGCERRLSDPENELWGLAAWFLAPGIYGNQFSSWQQLYTRIDFISYSDIAYKLNTTPGPLYYSLTHSLDTMATWLMQQLPDVRQAFPNGMSPLHVAAWAGRKNIVQKLLDAGAEVDTLSVPQGMTPLHLASTMSELSTVQLLLSKGADPNKASASSATPFYRACRGGSLQVVRTVHAAGANINAPTWDNWTPLHEAVENNHLDVVRQLLIWGAGLNAQTFSGFTPLRLAAEMGRYAIFIAIQEHALSVRGLKDLEYRMKIEDLQAMIESDSEGELCVSAVPRTTC